MYLFVKKHAVPTRLLYFQDAYFYNNVHFSIILIINGHSKILGSKFNQKNITMLAVSWVNSPEHFSKTFQRKKLLPTLKGSFCVTKLLFETSCSNGRETLLWTPKETANFSFSYILSPF
jgi:hypothetical protein